ncbi:MAG: DUF4394 domain-containing protein [Cyanobacteria bacterium P01_D01_bin.1]
MPDPDPAPGPAPSPAVGADGSQFLALTADDQLVSFDPDTPDQTTTIDIVGIDAPLLGIDMRPANGLVYGITTADTVYTINPNTGIATKIATLDTSFEGTTVSGFDFNPRADRLRLVGDNDQDFRINVETGEVTVDGDLRYAEGDANEGSNPRVTAAAYTNSLDGLMGTELYDIDTDLDVLVLQNPPNDGILMTVGSLGVDFSDIAGFDIISSAQDDNEAFAVSDSTLYSIDLEEGTATEVGTIGSGMESDIDTDTQSDTDTDTQSDTDTDIETDADGDSVQFKGLTTVDQSNIVNPIANGSRFLALSDDNQIDSFNPGNPKAVRSIDITGLGDGETLIGFDTRPSNGLIYGITDADRIYTIDPNSGDATFISRLRTPDMEGMEPTDVSFDATTISGFDFNPVADRLRLVGDNDQDFRINVETGEVTVDGDLAFAMGGDGMAADQNADADPKVTAVAYTNAIADPSSTQLYDIDTDLDILVLQNPPNDGTLMTIGDLGVDFGELGGFDIVTSQEDSNAAFAVSDGTLYSIDLLTGEASSLGQVGAEASTYLGFTTISNDVIDPSAVSVRADADGFANSAVYDVTAVNQASASLGNNPAAESSASFENYVGFYEVTDTNGGIDTNGDGTVDLNAGDDGYAAAAISRRLENLVIRAGGDRNATSSSFNPVVVTGGKFYAPFIIANLSDTTPEDFLTNNPDNSAATQIDDQVAYFSFVDANPDGAVHLKVLGSSASGGTTFGFEDLPDNLGVSDNDFNDAVFQVDFTAV